MSETLVTRHQERISLLDAEKIAGLDYETFVLEACDARTFSQAQFANGNRYGYYILMNTWCGLAFDLGGKSLSDILVANLRSRGVAKTSTVLKSVADQLVSSAANAEYLYDDSTPVEIDYSRYQSEELKVQELIIRIVRLSFPIARQLCVYPKRFAPIVPTRFSKLHEKAMQTFVDTMKANCATEYRINSLIPLVNPQPGDNRALPFHSSSVDEMALEVAKLARRIACLILGDFEGLKSTYGSSLPRFGPGACRNAGPGTLERYERCMQYGYYQPSVMPAMRAHAGLVYRPHPDTVSTYVGNGQFSEPLCRRGYWGKSPFPQVCEPKSVPKTVWANRLIATEDVCNMSNQLHLKDAMTARFAKTVGLAIPIRDQEENRAMARLAAYTNRLATLDLSHASDSVTKPLVRMLVPDSWYNAFESCVPYGYAIRKGRTLKVKPLHCFATMGCGCTFNVEALVFFALTAACVLIHSETSYELLSDAALLKLLREIHVRVMGDDIIAPSRCAEFVIAVLAYFGFEVNVDKSFIDGRFRESCGADWLRVDKLEGDGVVDVSCVYYPRIPIGRDIVSSALRSSRVWSEDEQEAFYESGLARLIALQQRLFDLSPTASQFILRLVQEHFPEISTSFPGEFPTTLWTYTPIGEYVYNVSDLAGVADLLDKSARVLRMNGLHSSAVYVDEATAERLCRRQLEGSVGRTLQAAEIPLLHRNMSWRRRRVLRLPGRTADVPSSVKGWSAELLLYELMLTRSALADDASPVELISGDLRLAKQSGRYSPLFCVRPARLSRAQLGTDGSFAIVVTL